MDNSDVLNYVGVETNTYDLTFDAEDSNVRDFDLYVLVLMDKLIN